jgi:POT family proton-dependent oligopeptide transporter
MTTDESLDKGWFGHPKGLSTLFFTEMWERLSYYGMRALLILYMVGLVDDQNAGLGFDQRTAATIYGTYTMLVYALALPGGIIADRWLGHYRAVFIGGVIIALGHFSLAVQTHFFFFAGLGLIIIGTGLLKPNISTMVGSLYEEGDPRRDGGFSMFYMGINIGAALAPIVCGTLGQRVGWHYGFGAAGVGMVAGLIQYWFGRDRLKVALKRIEDRKAARTEEAAVTHQKGFTPQEWKRLGVIGVLFIFSTLFWAAFEQAGSSLNQFADQFTNTTVLGWDFPSTWFQSLNPIYIVLFAPLYSWLWVWLNNRNREPAAPMKFVWGMLLVGLGFLLLLPPSKMIASDNTVQVAAGWLVFVYLFHTLGELCLSPVSLSMVTKLAPQKIVGSMMGFWFLSYALGNFISGQIAGFFPSEGDASMLVTMFSYVFYATFGSGLLLLFFTKPLTRMMGGIK